MRILDASFESEAGSMQELVGMTFTVGDGQYRVVDVRQLSGELMVYAEELDTTLRSIWTKTLLEQVTTAAPSPSFRR